MSYIKGIVVILLVLLGIIIAVQNYSALSSPVTFRFFDYESAEMPLYLVAIIVFAVGVVITGLYGMGELFRLKRQIKSLNKEAKQREKELSSLRNLPVTTGEENSGQDEGPA